MTIEERLKIVEDNLKGLISMVSTLRFNTDADINGTRQSVANITPWTQTKKAYIQDIEVVFLNVPHGSLTISCDVDYAFSRIYNAVVVTFAEPLEEVIDVTISIL